MSEAYREPVEVEPVEVEPVTVESHTAPPQNEAYEATPPWGAVAGEQSAPSTAVPSPAQAVPSPAQPRQGSERTTHTRFLILTIITALLAGILGASLASCVLMGADESITTTIEQITSTLPRETLGIDTGTELSVNVAAKVVPSVVSVWVTQEQMTMYGPMTAEGSGSGVIIRDNGYILTNYHVIELGTSIEVAVGPDTYPAEVVGTDPSSDLAVLKIDATGLEAITIGSSSDLKVGQYVMAVGAPFGLSESVSVGIISALGRTEAFQLGNQLAAYANLIQTDAAINPGNSGGALVDADGRLIGINTLIKTTSGSSAGVGFAIPVDTALDIAVQLMEGKTASHPFLGVSTQTIDAVSAQQFRLPVDSGAYIIEIVAGSPADTAGLQKGDIIVKVGSRTVSTSEDVFAAVRSQRAGDTITVEFYRGDRLESVEVTLVNDSASAYIQETTPQIAEGDAGTDGWGGQPDPHEGFTQQQLLDMLHSLGGGLQW